MSHYIIVSQKRRSFRNLSMLLRMIYAIDDSSLLSFLL